MHHASCKYRICKKYHKCVLQQGLLKIWTGHSHWFLLNPKPFEMALQKLQHFYNLERNEYSPNFKGVAQKLGLPWPLEVLDVFGGKSKFWAPMTLIFGTKRLFIEVNNWWNFGVDISNHFWVILIWPFFSSNSFPTTCKNNFQKLYLYIVGKEWEEQNGQIWTTQKFLHKKLRS